MILAVLAIVIVAFLAITFGGTTGKATSSTTESLTKVYVSADSSIISQNNPTIRPGQKIYITVEAGTERLDKDINIVYKESGLRVTSKSLKGCGGVDCDPGEIGKTDYKTSSDWYGEYCAKVRSYDNMNYWESCFTVQ